MRPLDKLKGATYNQLELIEAILPRYMEEQRAKGRFWLNDNVMRWELLEKINAQIDFEEARQRELARIDKEHEANRLRPMHKVKQELAENLAREIASNNGGEETKARKMVSKVMRKAEEIIDDNA